MPARSPSQETHLRRRGGVWPGVGGVVKPHSGQSGGVAGAEVTRGIPVHTRLEAFCG